MNTNVVLVTL